ncbi:Sulfate transporter [Thalictrum thalictroides]|uniref:Sulfate transporter n=1 Tax=Thalictrum thalictroides TaxID=46969 RepID=A0A7J6XDB0_THATH|nr:Sulfate transporter [Thalictrum thalictroides]
MYKNYHIDGNKEMIAFGMMNIAGSFTSCYLTTGPFSRSAVNFNAGCKTAVSNIVMALAVMITLLFLTPLFHYTPLVVLCAIIIAAMVGLIDYDKAIHLFKVDKFDFVVCMSAYIGVVFGSVETGLILAVALSILRVLLFVARPKTNVLGNIPNSMIYRNVNQYPNAISVSGVLILQIDAPIYFTNSSYLRERISRWIDEEEVKIKSLAESSLQYVILDMGAVSSIDTSGISMFEELKKNMDRRGLTLVLANPGGEVLKKFDKCKFIEEIGQEWIYLTVGEAVRACHFKLHTDKPSHPIIEPENDSNVSKVFSFPVSIALLSPHRTQLKPYNLKPPSSFNSNFNLLETLTMKTLDESDVGISCYISNLPGFRGILKQRYADFIVNEVDSDGNVVHLTSLGAPHEDVEVTKKEETKLSYTSEIELFRALAGDSNAELLDGLIDKITSGATNDVSPIVLSPESDKNHRTAIHNFFKEKLKFLVTDTVDGPDTTSKCIRVRLNSGHEKGKNSKKRKERGSKPFDSRGTDDWPENVGKYLRFHLYKENKDTQEALGVIGKMLGIQQRSFGFSGTKDKRSVSTQRVTVFKQHAKRLAALNDRLFGIKVGDFCFVKEGLLLGQLQGNRFTITLRGVIADSEDIIKSAADSLGRNGFINYFGLQRFGSGSVPTHLIGAALLRGEWKIAVGLFLDPREGDILLIRDDIREVREYFKESCDIEGTLRRLPRYLVAERAILQSLKKYPGNYLLALKAIPRTLRMMYVHSYQSYLWNHAASMRVQKQGTQLMLGDLVYSKGSSAEIPIEAIKSECEDGDCTEEYDCSHIDEISGIIPEEKNILVKVVDDDDLLGGEYTIEDMVLPLPGSKVRYPANDIAKVYHDLAKKDAISLTACVHNIKEFSITSLTGGYRQVFRKPSDFEWQLLHYTDPDVSLAETDLDIIGKLKPVNNTRVKANSENGFVDCSKQFENLKNEITPFGGKTQAGDDADVGRPQVNCVRNPDTRPPQVALKLGFILPASSYATMAIREMLKISTSVAFHKMMN